MHIPEEMRAKHEKLKYKWYFDILFLKIHKCYLATCNRIGSQQVVLLPSTPGGPFLGCFEEKIRV